MSWQTDLYARLRDRQWYTLGELFEEFQERIPLHHAMRTAMQPNFGRTELPLPCQARWNKFNHTLSSIGIEREGKTTKQTYKWPDKVRLRYVEGRHCETCGGPVIKTYWSVRPTRYASTEVACLACEQAAVAPPAPVVLPKPKPFCEQPVSKFQLVWKDDINIDRPGIISQIKKCIFPHWSLKQIEKAHANLPDQALWSRYAIRFWFHWNQRSPPAPR